MKKKVEKELYKICKEFGREYEEEGFCWEYFYNSLVSAYEIGKGEK